MEEKSRNIVKTLGKIFGFSVGAGAAAFGAVVFAPAEAAVGLVALAAVAAGFGGGLGVTSTGEATADAIYKTLMNSLRGKTVQILGPFQAGKNSVYNTITDSRANPNRTTDETFTHYEGDPKTELTMLDESEIPPGFLKDIFEVSGENTINWEQAIKNSNPHGIIYVVDSYTAPFTGSRRSRFQEDIKGLKIICNALLDIEDSRFCELVILLNKIDGIKLKDKADVVNKYINDISKIKIVQKFTLDSLMKSMKARWTVLPFCAQNPRRYQPDYSSMNEHAMQMFWEGLIKGKEQP